LPKAIAVDDEEEPRWQFGLHQRLVKRL
jgi:hypothetical protein